jgi:hypothetical protein
MLTWARGTGAARHSYSRSLAMGRVGYLGAGACFRPARE